MRLTIILINICLLTFIASSNSQIQIKTQIITIGNDSIKVIIYNSTDNGLVYFNMHDDENTCVTETLKILENTGGKLIELKHFGNLEDKGRYFSLKKQNKVYTFDPNRIFSDNDSARAANLIEFKSYYQAENILKKLNKSQIPTENECYLYAKQELKQLADTLIALIDTSSSKLIVALHNNHSFATHCDKNCNLKQGSYNLATYLRPETEENSSAEEIYINPKRNLSGFFIVLKYNYFMQLQIQRCNVILQSENSTDDSSFSVFALKQQLNYINIEAQRENKDEQQILLQTLSNMLMELKIEP